MASTPSPPKLSISVACGPVPCDTEEGRRYLQDRLSLFGKVGFVLCLGHFVFINSVFTVAAEQSWADWYAAYHNRLHLFACAIFAAVYLLCRGGRRSHGALAAIDTSSIFLIGATLGIRFSSAPESENADYIAMLGITNALIARAVIVPSSAPLTALSSTLATVPLIAGSWIFVEDGVQTAVVAVWAAVPIALATVTSRILYGLRQEVEEARQFGQYTLEERIGEGGMGEVYRASHAMLRRPTAIKLLRREGAAGERNLARFEREVQLTSRLTHPNTIAIFDYGRTPDGVFYYAMEYLDGIDLETLVDGDGPQPPGRVISILRQVCSSLAEAHGIGLIHRDIKPANIILCERGMMHDVVKVVDFGLVKDLDASGEGTVSGVNTITGTPLYMSPEAIRAPAQVSLRSDLYAVGAVGYYLLTGTHLFGGNNFMEICSHHLHTPPETPSSRLGREVPADLEGLILMCLEKDPERRPKDAMALRAALEKCEDADLWSAEDAARWWRERSDRIRAAARRGKDGSPAATPTEDGESFSTTKTVVGAGARAGRRPDGATPPG